MKIQRRAQQVLTSESNKFTDLVTIAGLDPSTDFRFSNLSGVDFKGCVLSGYDFTGANLANCDFSDAELSGAVFLNAKVNDATDFGDATPDLGQMNGSGSRWLSTFTPDGDEVSLPKGATTIDFAYAIHTEVGNSMVGVRVDGVRVPLWTKLKSGQTVTVIRAEGQTPQASWLEIATTAKARRKMRRRIREENEKRERLLCKNILHSDVEGIKDERSKTLAKEIVELAISDPYLFGTIVSDGRHNKNIVDAIVLGFICHHEMGRRDLISGKIPKFDGRLLLCRDCFPFPGVGIVGVWGGGRTYLHAKGCSHLRTGRRS